MRREMLSQVAGILFSCSCVTKKPLPQWNGDRLTLCHSGER